ncbi:MAG: sensor histidine kinase, partial [Longimicrobiales bacterium]
TPRDIRRAGTPIVEIVVADNGPGVAPEMIEQIFEPFVTTKEPGRGSGLGLAVCARLVDAMGGSIRADSRTGEGARFTVLLPALVPGQRLDPEAAHLPRVDA